VCHETHVHIAIVNLTVMHRTGERGGWENEGREGGTEAEADRA
jgi:hypothetical protein